MSVLGWKDSVVWCRMFEIQMLYKGIGVFVGWVSFGSIAVHTFFYSVIQGSLSFIPALFEI
jgi:hypothetical protein